MYGWPAYKPAEPQFPACVVMTDPTHDVAKCGKPATSGYTVLEYPICDECYGLVSL
jgi:hypothetical protein